MSWDINAIWYALYGGLLIGLAASILLLFNGKVAGISGILSGALNTSFTGQGWRLAFLFGLIISPIIYGLLAPLPEVKMTSNYPMIIAAGLLVGFGTRLSSGCTSGHGVCGIARFSVRSIVATLTFMAFGVFTVFVLRHLV